MEILLNRIEVFLELRERADIFIELGAEVRVVISEKAK